MDNWICGDADMMRWWRCGCGRWGGLCDDGDGGYVGDAESVHLWIWAMRDGGECGDADIGRLRWGEVWIWGGDV